MGVVDLRIEWDDNDLWTVLALNLFIPFGSLTVSTEANTQCSASSDQQYVLSWLFNNGDSAHKSIMTYRFLRAN